LPRLSMPCSILSRTACSTACCTFSPRAAYSAGIATASRVARGCGRVRPASAR
jgi:hypothetical protein